MKRINFFSILLLTLLMSESVLATTWLNMIEQNNKEVGSSVEEEMTDKQYTAWSKDKYYAQHQALIPKVAVANIFWACNKIRKTDPIGYRLKDLILKMRKDQLALKLSECLGDDEVKSNIGLNFGLVGCFSDQFLSLPAEEKKLKMALVNSAIEDLTREEREQSFAKCVNQQSFNYIQ
ncbi:MAG: hypothetical protein ACPGTQ_02620 [Colwellia sp.]